MKTLSGRMLRKGARMHYVWCHEIRSHDYEGVECDYEHYHVICILDKSVHTLAKFYAICTDLQKTGWLDSFHLSKDAGSTKVHDLKTVEGYQEAKWHASYIAKVETKIPTHGRRLYGRSKINHHDLMPLPTKHRLKPLNDRELDGEVDFIQACHVDDLNHLATKHIANTQTTTQHQTATSAVFLCREEMNMTSKSSQQPVKHGTNAKPDSERYRNDRAGNAIDWSSIERDFIAGILSIRAIASGANIADITVRRKASLEGWQRNLAPRVLATAQNSMLIDIGDEHKERERRKTQQDNGAAFSHHGVQSLLTQTLRARGESASTYADDGEQVALSVSGQTIINIMRTHRQDIAKAREVVNKLMHELRPNCSLSLTELLELAFNDDYDENTRQIYQKLAIERVINLADHARVARDLMSALKVVITLERQALRINEMTHDINAPAPSSTPPATISIQALEDMLANAKANFDQ
ncbi:hypothetical protein [Deefgea sp. CFH1-16]|uniref:hypothetical protein n=1 Tax=Deefgea sp. CFH1-16 TaxID=2675457 RepID=UPI0015F5997D|nr:hypothetical protein [Deefgea sp. CFH1-16]MBM5573034.1 hypothetical protein [Deefgea sp. CFH1-16]